MIKTRGFNTIKLFGDIILLEYPDPKAQKLKSNIYIPPADLGAGGRVSKEAIALHQQSVALLVGATVDNIAIGDEVLYNLQDTNTVYIDEKYYIFMSARSVIANLGKLPPPTPEETLEDARPESVLEQLAKQVSASKSTIITDVDRIGASEQKKSLITGPELRGFNNGDSN